MVTWRTTSVIIKVVAAFSLACAAALTALGQHAEIKVTGYQESLPISTWFGDDTRLIGNVVILAFEIIFMFIALLFAILLLCKKFQKPCKAEYVFLVLGTLILLLCFCTEAWYSTCYDGEKANEAEDNGDVCIVQGWVSAAVCLCAATILYGIDAFVWYFCRKRRVTWVGWYYDDDHDDLIPRKEPIESAKDPDYLVAPAPVPYDDNDAEAPPPEEPSEDEDDNPKKSESDNESEPDKDKDKDDEQEAEV